MGFFKTKDSKDVLGLIVLGVVLFFTILIFFGLVYIGTFALLSLIGVDLSPFGVGWFISPGVAVVGVILLLWIFHYILKT